MCVCVCAHASRQGRNCQSCAHLLDAGHWVVVRPSVSLEGGVCVYSLSSPAGSYECHESGLRWSCAGPVTLQYRFSKEELFWAQLQMLWYQPAGPLLEIKLLSGELEEVHLPHCLCLGGSDPSVLGDAVRALHGDDSGVSLETCELSRFHGRLSAQHFSLWQLVVRLGFPVKSHCEVLIYEYCPQPLVLHTFLLPTPSSARQAVEEWWERRGALSIVKPSPNDSLSIGCRFQLRISPDSCSPEITPSEVTFTYKNPPTFFEVCLRNPLEDFRMELKTVENRTVWEAVLRQGADYHRTRDHADTPQNPDYLDLTQSCDSYLDLTQSCESYLDLTQLCERWLDLTQSCESYLDLTQSCDSYLDLTQSCESYLDLIQLCERWLDLTQSCDIYLDRTQSCERWLDLTQSCESYLDRTQSCDSYPHLTQSCDSYLDLTQSCESYLDLTQLYVRRPHFSLCLFRGVAIETAHEMTEYSTPKKRVRMEKDTTGRCESPCVSEVSYGSIEQPPNFTGEDSKDRVRMEKDTTGRCESSCVSEVSYGSMERPPNITGEDSKDRVRMEKDTTGRCESSCVSEVSYRSMERPPNITGEDSKDRVRMEKDTTGRCESPCVSEVSYGSMERPPNITGEDSKDRVRMEKDTTGRCESPCVSEVSYGSMERPPNITGEDSKDRVRMEKDTTGRCESSCVSEVSYGSMERPPNITGEDSKDGDMFLEEEVMKVDHKSPMKERYSFVFEGQREASSFTAMPSVDTDMYITSHRELSQATSASCTALLEEEAVGHNHILRPLGDSDNRIRSVLTLGVSGVGKTVTVQKFILDWAEGKANQHVTAIVPVPFRELNLLMGKRCSLQELVQHFHSGTVKMPTQSSDAGQCQVMFIFDGLDECQYPLDFQNNPSCSDVVTAASVDVLLTNLISGNLLPSALLWITSRPEAAWRVPPSFIDRQTEIRGFSDSSKEKYIQRKTGDKASSILRSLKAFPSLYNMCQIPIYCWILVSVLESCDPESGDMPKTLTQIYTHFLLIQTNVDNEKSLTHNIIFKLSKLAFQQLEKGNLMFYEDDLKRSDLTAKEVSLYQGLCAENLRVELGLRKETVFHFWHISIQEHLAALYVFLNFADREEGTCCATTSKLASLFRASTLYELLKSAVDLSLNSADGQLDFFLRFLVGFSLESNHTLLKGLLQHEGSTSTVNRKTAEYIQKKIRENPFPEKSMNLFHCLSELHNLCSLQEEVRGMLSKGGESRPALSPAQCSAVAFLLLNSGEHMEEFDVAKYTSSEECALRLLPVIKASRSALLRGCNITSQGCKALASILQSDSQLQELDLSDNNLKDSGFYQLNAGLQHPLCNIHTLKLWYCNLTERSCELLAKTLDQSWGLRVLNLSRNHVQDSGLTHLCTGLRSPTCQLEKLKLVYCGISAAGCRALGSVVGSEGCSLRELSLSDNELQDTGMRHLCSALGSPHCRLEKLEVRKCGLTGSSCAALGTALGTALGPALGAALGTALGSSHSRLRELDLSNNLLKDAGVKMLLGAPPSPHNTLQRLVLRYCGLTAGSCDSLSAVLSSLEELDVSGNNLQDSGVKSLCSALSEPSCVLRKLGLSHCGVSDVGGVALGSALGGSPGRMEVLELTGNSLQDPVLRSRLLDLHCLL
ncbi:hypothetical protein ACEWY4_008453 [Coilia grayii]|uniref:NACHT domain-containing protein n=1 Tax=Coilia grayii TaxID=363190 RepID=A0ABD1KB10_9TELE